MCVCVYVCLYFNLSIHTYVSGLRKWESLRVPLTKPEKFTENQERADEFATDNSYLTSYGLTIWILELYCMSQWKYLVSSCVYGSKFQWRKLSYNSGCYQHKNGKWVYAGVVKSLREHNIREAGQEWSLDTRLTGRGRTPWLEGVSLVAQMVKKLPEMQDTWVWSLGQEKKWQPTLVFLPRKFHGWRSLVGYSPVGYGPWGCKELDTTEQLTQLGWRARKSTELWIKKIRTV